MFPGPTEVRQVVKLRTGDSQARAAPPDLAPRDPHEHLMQPGQGRLLWRAGTGQRPQLLR